VQIGGNGPPWLKSRSEELEINARREREGLHYSVTEG